MRSLFFVASVLATSVPAAAATYVFDYTYNGTSMVLDAGSQDPLGQSIAINDTFTINLKAGANKAWSVLGSFTSSIDNSFFVQTCGARTGNMVATRSLNGTDGNATTINGLGQSCIHVGGQQIAYTAGEIFDALSISLTLLSDPGSTVIQDRNPEYFGSFTGFTQLIRYIDYEDSAVIPLPASLPLLLAGLAGMGGLVARRRVRG